MYDGTVKPGIAALAASLVLATVGCNSASNSTETSPSATAPASAIAGAGSTFVAPLMSAWIDGYQKTHPKAQVTYRAIGSGGGSTSIRRVGSASVPVTRPSVTSRSGKCLLPSKSQKHSRDLSRAHH